MSDDNVHVPFGDNQSETASLLLDAAEKSKDYEQNVVFVDHFTDSFVVPASIASAAGLDTTDPDDDFIKEVGEAQKAAETDEGQSGELLNQPVTDEAPAEAPAKKAAAKKSAAKK